MGLIIKVIGSAILILSFSLWGFSASSALKTREKQLARYKWYITELKERIFYEEIESELLIKSVFKDKGIIQNINGRYFICDKAIKKCDKEILNEFLGRLGSSEKESEIARAQLCLSLIEAERVKAVKQTEEKSKLYKILGVCSGLVGSILLI